MSSCAGFLDFGFKEIQSHLIPIGNFRHELIARSERIAKLFRAGDIETFKQLTDHTVDVHVEQL